MGAHDDRAGGLHLVEQLRPAKQRGVDEHLLGSRVRCEPGSPGADGGGVGRVDEHEVDVRDRPRISRIERYHAVACALEAYCQILCWANLADEQPRRHERLLRAISSATVRVPSRPASRRRRPPVDSFAGCS